MFDPDGDMGVLYTLLSSDTTLMNLLGWTSGSKVGFIWKATKNPTLKGKDSTLCFYPAPSRLSTNPLTSEEIVQFDCHSPSISPQIAYQIQKRIKTLLHMKPVNGRRMWWAGIQGDLPTATGYVCLGVRYRYSIVI